MPTQTELQVPHNHRTPDPDAEPPATELRDPDSEEVREYHNPYTGTSALANNLTEITDMRAEITQAIKDLYQLRDQLDREIEAAVEEPEDGHTARLKTDAGTWTINFKPRDKWNKSQIQQALKRATAKPDFLQELLDNVSIRSVYKRFFDKLQTMHTDDPELQEIIDLLLDAHHQQPNTYIKRED